MEHIEIKEENEVIYNYQSLSIKEIKEIALGIVDGKYFASWMIAEYELNLLHSIFMPMIFLDDIHLKQLEVNQIAHFYGDCSRSKTGINGYPMMTEMRCLDINDSQKIVEQIKIIMKMREDFLNNE